MEAIKEDKKQAEIEKSEEEKERLELEAFDKAMTEFRLSTAYPYIIKSIDEKIKEVTDTRILAKSFGQIKSQFIGELGTLGVASLMAADPLERLKEEIE
jgi:hypothetical protein